MSLMHRALATLLFAVAAVSQPVVAGEQAEPAGVIEKRIEEAREQLDRAARQLAELHSQLWQLETSGPRAERPMLGILIDEAGSTDGLVLHGVTPESGAARSGLMAGDRIVEVNGVRLDGASKKPLQALGEAMAPVRAGDAVVVAYVREGQTHEVQLVTQPRGRYMARVIGEKGPMLESLRSLGKLEHLEALQGLEALDLVSDLGSGRMPSGMVRVPAGLRLEDIQGDLAGYFQVDDGVLVLSVPAKATDLKAGDVLRRVDGEPVTGAMNVLRRLAGLEGTVEVQVLRQGREYTATLNLDEVDRQQAFLFRRGDREIYIRQGGGRGKEVEVRVLGDD
jgi:S1-C subfamily serine protease